MPVWYVGADPPLKEKRRTIIENDCTVARDGGWRTHSTGSPLPRALNLERENAPLKETHVRVVVL